ncbi:MAG: polysaccharide deacetylase family protein [Solirubrobacteraceae bacterium]
MTVASLATAPTAGATERSDDPSPRVERTGRAVGGPLALRRVGVVQDGTDLRWRIVTAKGWPTASLRAGRGRRICLSTHRRDGGEAHRACVSAKGRRLRLRGTVVGRDGIPKGWRTIRARITRPDSRTLQVVGPVAELGRRYGTVRWTVSSAWRGGASCSRVGACADRLPGPKRRPATYGTRRPVPIGCVPRGATRVTHGPAVKEVALTFDDGPATITSRWLDVLREHDAVGTFFVLGSQVHGRESLLRRMVREGHAVGNHSYDHANLAGGGRGQLGRTNAIIRAASGVQPCVFRPPGGATSGALDAEVRSAGMHDVLWSIDTNDWQGPGAATIASRALAAGRGGIVLMHDGGGPREPGLAALPTIIRGLRARGYRLVTVPDLLRLRPRYAYDLPRSSREGSR